MSTKKRPDWVPNPKLFLLDGEPVDLAEFYQVNDLDPDQVNAIGKLEVGQEYVFGGGAAAEFVLRRVQ